MFATVKISITDLSQKRSDRQDAALVLLATWDRTTETNDPGRHAAAKVPRGWAGCRVSLSPRPQSR